MKCPICGKEMEEGFIQTGERMAWVKRKHRISLEPKNGEVLLGNNIFNGLLFPASICKDCKKVTIDYSGADHVVGQ